LFILGVCFRTECEISTWVSEIELPRYIVREHTAIWTALRHQYPKNIDSTGKIFGKEDKKYSFQ
jgi:hypothetical protein